MRYTVLAPERMDEGFHAFATPEKHVFRVTGLVLEMNDTNGHFSQVDEETNEFKHQFAEITIANIKFTFSLFRPGNRVVLKLIEVDFSGLSWFKKLITRPKVADAEIVSNMLVSALLYTDVKAFKVSKSLLWAE